MGSTLRVALGRCSCKEEQPPGLRQAMCRDLSSRLASLRAKPDGALAALPAYEETSAVIEGHSVNFETIAERLPGDDRLLVVVRAFARSWSRPNWVAFSGTGYMFADGFLVSKDGSRMDAPDEFMWDFR